MKKAVKFKSNKLTLRGTLMAPDNVRKFPAVAYFHGRGSTYKKNLGLGEKLAKNKIAFFGFDFTGSPDSEGDFGETTIRGKIDDARAGLDFLLSQEGVDKERLGLMGGSQGGHIAAILAHKYNARSLILAAPVAYPESILDKKETVEAPPWKDKKENWLDSRSFKEIEEFKSAFLIIEKELHEAIPHEMIMEYFERAKTKQKSRHVIKESIHALGQADSPFRKEAIRVAADWFVKTLLN